MVVNLDFSYEQLIEILINFPNDQKNEIINRLKNDESINRNYTQPMINYRNKGLWKGQGFVSDDFNDSLDDFKEYE
jgi:hypothetical protein